MTSLLTIAVNIVKYIGKLKKLLWGVEIYENKNNLCAIAIHYI